MSHKYEKNTHVRVINKTREQGTEGIIEDVNEPESGLTFYGVRLRGKRLVYYYENEIEAIDKNERG